MCWSHSAPSCLQCSGREQSSFFWLFFLLLYTLIDAVELSLAALFDVSMINASQFGFILLSIIGFILGMRPAAMMRKT